MAVYDFRLLLLQHWNQQIFIKFFSIEIIYRVRSRAPTTMN